jgi:hypothetical protein
MAIQFIFIYETSSAINEIATLVDEQWQAGVYRADFAADNLPSGMYFARITANVFTQVVKMILLK